MDARILEHLSVLPISDEGEAKHFVHLTQVLDKIFELATLDDPEVDKKVLDVIKRVKSLPIMKISLNKLVSSTLYSKHTFKYKSKCSDEPELEFSSSSRAMKVPSRAGALQFSS